MSIVRTYDDLKIGTQFTFQNKYLSDSGICTIISIDMSGKVPYYRWKQPIGSACPDNTNGASWEFFVWSSNNVRLVDTITLAINTGTPADRICTNKTCERVCDVGKPCWWCGEAP